MKIELALSSEELNLYNPAYVGTILYQAIRECLTKNSRGLHCSLVYLIAPLALSHRYSSTLPASVSTPIAGWTADYEGNLIGFASSVRAYIDVVNLAISFLLEHGAVNLSDDGHFIIQNDAIPKMPALINKNHSFKKAFASAGFLGRWFGQSSSIENIYAYFGVKP